MMKRLFVFLWLSCFMFFSLSAGLIDIYKKGEIKLNADPGFGKNTDWGIYLNKSRTFTVGPNGSIFVVDSNRSIVSKFDGNGAFLLNFGQPGQGPGDLNKPGSVSILDGRYLVIGDSAAARKISLFDLNGRFIKVLRTSSRVYDCVGLKDNKIALLSKRTNLRDKSQVMAVSILNIDNSEEKIIAEKGDRIRMVRSPELFIIAPDLQDNGIIRKLSNGNLLVGFVYNDFIDMYSPDGEKVKTIPLKIPRVEVTDKVVDEYKNNYITVAKKFKWHKSMDFYKKYKSSAAIKKMFSPHLPIFSNYFVDSEDNILVFYYTKHRLETSPKFRVYSKDGTYYCDSAVNFMKYEPVFIDTRFSGFIFRNHSLYTVLDTDERSVVKADLHPQN